MKSANIYLFFEGKCEEAFCFYEKALNGKITNMGRFADMPQGEGMPTIPQEEKEYVMHAHLEVNENVHIMGSDTSETFGQKLTSGNNFNINLNAGSKEEADRLFVKLSEGGRVTMPIQNTFWGAYFGSCTDKFGVNWMVNYEE